MSIFSTYETYFKIAVILVYTGFIWYCHTVYDGYKKENAAESQIAKSDKGQSDIIKFNQELRNSNASKDPCFNTPLPADVKRLLK